MRNIALAAGLVLAGLSLGSTAQADPYRWCAQYGPAAGGGTNCYFVSLPQCRAAVSGVGGFCRPNPFYTGRNREIRRRAR